MKILILVLFIFVVCSACGKGIESTFAEAKAAPVSQTDDDNDDEEEEIETIRVLDYAQQEFEFQYNGENIMARLVVMSTVKNVFTSQVELITFPEVLPINLSVRSLGEESVLANELRIKCPKDARKLGADDILRMKKNAGIFDIVGYSKDSGFGKPMFAEAMKTNIAAAFNQEISDKLGQYLEPVFVAFSRSIGYALDYGLEKYDETFSQLLNGAETELTNGQLCDLMDGRTIQVIGDQGIDSSSLAVEFRSEK